ncbi:hypothetical protein AAMO2058_000335300 [Amorphochlora amoebiformis]
MALCANRKQLTEALEIFTELGDKANSHSYAILVNTHIRCGDTPGAIRLFEDMKEKDLNVGVVVCTSVIKAHCADGHIGRAWELIEWMENQSGSDTNPNIRTVNTLLRGCLTTGDVSTAEASWEKMSVWNITPDTSTYEYTATLLAQGLKMKKLRLLISSADPPKTRKKSKKVDQDIPNPNPPLPSPLPSSTLALLHLHHARALTVLGRIQKAKTAIERARVLCNKSDKESKTIESTSGTSGGQRGWGSRNQDKSRAESNAAYRAHRVEQIERDLKALEAYSKDQIKRSAGLMGFQRLYCYHPQTHDAVSVTKTLVEKFGLKNIIKAAGEGEGRGGWSLKSVEKKISDSFDPEGFLRITPPNDPHLQPEGLAKSPNKKSKDSAKSPKKKPENSEDSVNGQLPVMLELGAGNGEWAVSQAKASENKCFWIANEFRLDRSYRTVTRGIVTQVDNLWVLAGDAREILKNWLKPNSIKGTHLLTLDFFRSIHRVLQPGGRLTIVTDNDWYGRFLLKTVGQLTRGRKNSLIFSQPDPNPPPPSAKIKERNGRFNLWAGAPGRWCGYFVAASSYFDRVFAKQKKVERFTLFVEKKAMTGES